MNIKYRNCKRCDDKYEYMVSSSSVSPRAWNNKRGVTNGHCSKRNNKVLPRIKRWVRYRINALKRWRKGKRVSSRTQEVYEMGPVTPCPYPKMNGGILSYDSKYEGMKGGDQ